MRHILLPLCGLVLLFCISLGSDALLRREADALLSRLEAVEESAASEDWRETDRRLAALHQEAERTLELLSSLVAHDETEEETELLTDLSACVALRERTETLRAVAALRGQLAHMRGLDDLTPGNLF